ncbi:MAG: alanine--glyoxylate aminotransferase family protein [Symbiobacteriaceae bacterium]|nr:alanine--glyoxylate aminotransferase family protein [Symbiobacteriaceae bacterium]
MTRNTGLLMIPGPTPLADEVYDALGSEMFSFADPRFAQVFREALAMTQDMLGNPEEVYIIPGSGLFAMEIALTNCVQPGEKILIINQGYFGDRFSQIANAYGIEYEEVKAEWGTRVDPQEVAQALAKGGFKAVTLTHVDTSVGVLADFATLIPLIKESGSLLIVDGVCATAAVEESFTKGYGANKANIDVLLTAGQKAIGCPPGLAIVAFSPDALAARAAMPKIPAYFGDINNWRIVMKEPGRAFGTPPVSMINAYHAALKLVYQEGLEVRYQRHERYGKAMRAALRALGLTVLAGEEVTAPTISCVLYPEGIVDAEFRKALAAKGMMIAGAMSRMSGKAFRIGHMGSTTPQMLEQAIALLGETLNEMGFSADGATAVAVLQAKLFC